MNSKMRVYELAKEMLTDSKVIVRIMEQMGLDVKNHMSTLDQPTAQKIREVLTGKSKIRLDAPRKPKAGAQASSATTPPRAVAPDRVEATRTAERSTPRRRPDRVSATRTVERQAVPQKPGQTASRATRRVAPRAEGASGTPSWGPGAYAGPRPYTPPPVPRRPRPVRRTEPVRTEDAAVKERSTDEDVLSAIRTIEEQPAVETPEAPEVAIPKETPDVSVLAEQAKEQPPAEEEVASSEAAPEPIQTQELSEQEPDETPVRDLPTRPVPQMPQRRQQPVRAATDTGRTRPREMPIPASEVAKMREREAASRPVMRTERSYPTRPQPGAPSRGPQRPGSQGPRGQVTIPAPPTTPGQADQSRQGGRGRQRGGGSRYSRGRDRRLNSEDGQRLSRLRKGYPIRRTDARRSTAPPKEVIIDGPVTVKELASKMAMSVGDLIKRLMDAGIMATINHELDVDTAQIMGEEIGIPVRFKPPELSAEEKMEARAQEEDSPEDLLPRPPVVTVMGHVDHGKTSLLDAIRETNVAAGEAGGITQHIGASVAEIDGRKIVFLDTPGHEAFTAMRARGAEATDVAVLVVAADDGVMPQTKEAISHARSAGVPLVVALNKTDIPTANPDLVKRQLLEEGVVPEEWGGQTIIVPVSAKLREGIETLLEMILLTAEMEELKGNPNRLARGFVIEAQIDRGRGPVATVLVQNGTLEVGHAFVSGATYGRVRALMDDRGRRVKSAGPSIPVEVIGLTDLPQAGDVFQVVEDERVAREIALSRSTRRRSTELEATRRATLEDLYVLSKEGEVRDLNILVKADVQGTLEAMRNAMEGMRNEEVRVSIVHQGVGGINESDVMLASASNATVLGFNVRPTVGARKLAETDGVDLRMYRVIYDAVDDIKAALTGMLKPKMHEVVYGRAEVRATFRVPRVGTVAGCYVTDGKAMRSANVRVVRDGIVVHEGKLATLRRFKDDVREVQEGFECGIGLERYQDLKEGDVFEFFGEEEVKAG